MEVTTAVYRKPKERMVVRRTRGVRRGTRARSDGESFDNGRRGSFDTSFDDVLDIVVCHMRRMGHRTWLHMVHRGFLLLRNHLRFLATIGYVLPGAQQMFSGPILCNLV